MGKFQIFPESKIFPPVDDQTSTAPRDQFSPDGYNAPKKGDHVITEKHYDTYLSQDYQNISNHIRRKFKLPRHVISRRELKDELKAAKNKLEEIMRHYPGGFESQTRLSVETGLNIIVKELVFPLLVDISVPGKPVVTWVYRYSYPSAQAKQPNYHSLKRIAIQKFLSQQGVQGMQHIVLLYPELEAKGSEEFLQPWLDQSQGYPVQGLDLSEASHEYWRDQLFKLIDSLQKSQLPQSGNDSES